VVIKGPCSKAAFPGRSSSGEGAPRLPPVPPYQPMPTKSKAPPPPPPPPPSKHLGIFAPPPPPGPKIQGTVKAFAAGANYAEQIVAQQRMLREQRTRLHEHQKKQAAGEARTDTTPVLQLTSKAPAAVPSEPPVAVAEPPAKAKAKAEPRRRTDSPPRSKGSCVIH
jgi:hypothetical protein